MTARQLSYVSGAGALFSLVAAVINLWWPSVALYFSGIAGTAVWWIFGVLYRRRELRDKLGSGRPGDQ